MFDLSVEFNEKLLGILPKVIYFVVAEHFARNSIWQNHSTQAYDMGFRSDIDTNPNFTDTGRFDFDQSSFVSGMQEIGKLNKLPVVIAAVVEKIDGHWVCFHYACSAVVDHHMVEDWMESKFPDVEKTDANNFGHVIGKIRDLNKGLDFPLETV